MSDEWADAPDCKHAYEGIGVCPLCEPKPGPTGGTYRLGEQTFTYKHEPVSD